jgi:hypothetical protein
LREFENRLLRMICKSKKSKGQEAGENCIMRNFMISAYYGDIQDEMGGACSMQNVGREIED